MRDEGDDRRVIVIGSGPSGAVAALALIERGIPVTMLESGTRQPRGLLVRAWGRNIFRRRPALGAGEPFVASDDAGTRWFHEFAPGGLSNHWTGAVPRFAPADFHEGERLHERYRWPVAYADLAPYYDRMERLLGVAGDPRPVPHLPAARVAHRQRLPSDWQRIARHAVAAGQGLTPLPLADGPSWMVTRSAAPFNSFLRIVQGLRRSRLFDLRLGAHALRIDWSGAKRRADAVIYVDRATGAEHRLDGAAVVLAAGPLASTKLLLNSSCSDFPGGLGNTHGVLGRYLHDHAHDWFLVETDRPLTILGQAAYLTRAPYEASAPLLAAGCTLSNAMTAADKVLRTVSTRKNQVGVITFGTMVPTDDTFVRLNPEVRDQFGLPTLDLHIRFDEAAQRNIIAARDRLLAIFRAAGVNGRVREALPRLVPGSSVHYGGTVRMHDAPQYGMLDRWNRLHAAPNVAVVDAAAFTTGVEKNPTLTAMALASRAGQQIARDLMAS
jgi:choline dehydrogenase-like flavoprotein